mmetsp:Transcript_15476/g.46458  ORF Transcript_15476/g.46458 Transcript_15476/m.46458 type:complete len:393 (+) Transcript_15476:53-1231(+)
MAAPLTLPHERVFAAGAPLSPSRTFASPTSVSIADVPRQDSDAPGLYTVVHQNAAVRSGLSLDSEVLTKLPWGTEISVVEIIRRDEDERVRGRIGPLPALNCPAGGWLSLADTRSGYRWAKRAENQPAPAYAAPALDFDNQQEGLLREVQRKERDIEDLRARVERLRADKQTALNVQEDRLNEIEARLLKAHLQPLAHDLPPPISQAHRNPNESRHPALFEEIRAQKAKQQGCRHTMLEHPDTLPPGGRVIGIRHLDVFHGQVDYVDGQSFRRPGEEPEPEMEGRVLLNNSVLLPSPYHSPEWLSEQGLVTSLAVEIMGEEGYPVNVYPVTRPPPELIGINRLDSHRPWETTMTSWKARSDHFDSRACNLAPMRDEVTGEVFWRSGAPRVRG